MKTSSQKSLSADASVFLDGTLNTDGNGAGQGGSVSFETGGMNFIFATVSANGGTDGGAGGTITISADSVAGSEEGVLQANGVHDEAGGTISISSSGDMDLSGLSISADGGELEGDGGTISLSYGSSDTLLVKDVSAKTGSGDGAEITITNTTDADLSVVVTGSIKTVDEEAEELAGLFTLVPFDDQTNNISLSITSEGSFSGIVSATGASIGIYADPIVNMGLGDLETKNGDLNVCATGDGTCSGLALVRHDAEPLKVSESTLKLVRTIKVKGGVGTLTHTNIDLAADFSGAVHDELGILRSLTFECDTIKFGDNALLDGEEIHEFNITNHAFGNLTVTLPSDSGGGFLNASKISIKTIGAGTLSFLKSGSNPTFLIAGTNTDADQKLEIRSAGGITIAEGITIGSNDPGAPSVNPLQVEIDAPAGAVTINGSIFAFKKILIDNHESNQLLTTSGNLETLYGLGNGTTIEVKSGFGLVQTDGLYTNHFGVVTLTCANGDIGSLSERVLVLCDELKIDTASAGSAYVTNTSPDNTNCASAIALGHLSLWTVGFLGIVGSAAENAHFTATNGNIEVCSINEAVNLALAVITAGGSIQFACQSLTSSPVIGIQPSNITVNTGTGAGSVYWGTDTSGVPDVTAQTTHGSNVINLNTGDVVFQPAHVVAGIDFAGGVTITAG